MNDQGWMIDDEGGRRMGGEDGKERGGFVV
jgi:hypothetical protein